MTDLVASLVLKLEDGISGGLRAVEKVLEQISAITDRLSLDRMTQSVPGVDSLNTALGRTRGLLGTIGDLAKGVGEKFAAMGRAGIGAVNELGDHMRTLHGRIQGFQHASSNLVNAGFGAAAEGFLVYEPIKQYAERDRDLRQQGLMEGLHGAALQAEIARVNAMVNTDALATGQSSQSITEARFDLGGQGLGWDKVDSVLRAHSEAATAYNISAEKLGPITGAILGNLGVTGTAPMEGALAAVAAASQQGRVKIEDMALAMPGLTGTAAALGMKGRGSLDTLLAGLEISAKTASDGTQAGYHFHDLLEGMTSFRADHMAQKRLGINMDALLLQGEKQGKDPLDVYLDEIRKLTAGKSPVAQQTLISSIVGQAGARSSLLALVQHYDEFEKLRKTLDGISQLKLKIDLASVMGDPATQLSNMGEALGQIERTLGQGFMPVLTIIAQGILKLNDALTYLNTNFPKTTAWVLGGFAALLALGSALTIIGAVIPLVAAGFGILLAVLQTLLSPIIAIGAILGAMAYDIYENWANFRGFFVEMWEGVKQTFWGFVAFLRGVFTLDFHTAMSGLGNMGAGLTKLFSGYWGAVKTVFMDFVHWVDGWAAGLGTGIINGITSGWGAVTGGVHNLLNGLRTDFDDSKLGRLLGLAEAKTAAPAASNDNAKSNTQSLAVNGSVDIRVSAAPGTAVTSAQSSGAVNVQAPISAPSRGATVGRP